MISFTGWLIQLSNRIEKYLISIQKSQVSAVIQLRYSLETIQLWLLFTYKTTQHGTMEQEKNADFETYF